MPSCLICSRALQFVQGADFVVIAVDDLDGLGQSARHLGPPDLAVRPGADALQQHVTGMGCALRRQWSS